MLKNSIYEKTFPVQPAQGIKAFMEYSEKLKLFCDLKLRLRVITFNFDKPRLHLIKFI